MAPGWPQDVLKMASGWLQDAPRCPHYLVVSAVVVVAAAAVAVAVVVAVAFAK